jgi:raffinose/stachyose/melibiose transport system substrate-binding protein
MQGAIIMKQKTGTFISLTLVLLILTGFLTACQTTGADDKNSKTSGSASVAESDIANINFMHFWPKEEELQAVIDDFMVKNPSITVEVENSSVANHYTTLNTRIASGSTPDVFTGWPGPSMQPYFDSEICKDLSAMPWVSQFKDSAIRTTTYNGKILQMPVNIAVMGVLYNKKVFSDVGIVPPKTYAEFETICDKIKAKGITPLMTGSDYMLFVSSIMSVSDVYSKTPDFDSLVSQGKEKFNNAAWEKIFSRMCVEWPAKGYIPGNVLSIDRLTYGLSSFIKGKSAMIVIGSWDLPIIREISPDIELGMFPFPAEKSEDTALLAAAGEAFSISAESKFPKAAEKLLSYLASDDANKKICIAINSYSAKKDVKLSFDVAADEILPYLAKPNTHGFMMWPMPVQTQLNQMGDVLAGRKDLKTVLDHLQEIWMDEVNKTNSSN